MYSSVLCFMHVLRCLGYNYNYGYIATYNWKCTSKYDINHITGDL